MKDTFKIGLGLVVVLIVGGILLIPTIRLFFWVLLQIMKYPLISFILLGIPTSAYIGYIIGKESKK